MFLYDLQSVLQTKQYQVKEGRGKQQLTAAIYCSSKWKEPSTAFDRSDRCILRCFPFLSLSISMLALACRAHPTFISSINHLSVVINERPAVLKSRGIISQVIRLETVGKDSPNGNGLHDELLIGAT